MTKITNNKPSTSKTREEFSMPSVSEPQTSFNLVDMKKSLLDFNSEMRTSKSIRFAEDGRLQLPVFSSDPTVGEIGEIALIGGVVKAVKATVNTWVAV